MLSVACTTKAFGDGVHETRTTEERYKCPSTQRMQRCVNMLRAQSGELDGRGQVEMMEPGQYSDIEVADDKYKIVQQVRIMDDPHCIDNKNTKGHSGAVVRCARERNSTLHITTVYVLLDKFKAYGPLIAVKGTPDNLCLCGEELQSIDMDCGWTVWKLPLPDHWEICKISIT